MLICTAVPGRVVESVAVKAGAGQFKLYRVTVHADANGEGDGLTLNLALLVVAVPQELVTTAR